MDRKCTDCSYCNIDFPDHSCKNCRSEMAEESCFEFKGFCSQKCLDYMNIEIPRIRQEKIDKGIKCQCEEVYCGKCLGGNCKDNNCPTHTNEAKSAWLKRNKR
jgi:hypothetical protein